MAVIGQRVPRGKDGDPKLGFVILPAQPPGAGFRLKLFSDKPFRCVNGCAGSSEMFLPFADKLAECGYQVFMPAVIAARFLLETHCLRRSFMVVCVLLPGKLRWLPLLFFLSSHSDRHATNWIISPSGSLRACLVYTCRQLYARYKG